MNLSPKERSPTVPFRAWSSRMTKALARSCSSRGSVTGALEALAARRGRDLGAEGVSVVSIGGAMNIRRALDVFGPRGRDARLAGLCDAAEEGDFRRGLELAGLGVDLTRERMEDLGFYVCVEDLEDELIRCLGDGAVEGVLD